MDLISLDLDEWAVGPKLEITEKNIDDALDSLIYFTNLENPNAPLCVIDIMELKLPYFDSSITEQCIKELNIEIFKRIVRERLPHKFA
jgi:hypothetical protein